MRILFVEDDIMIGEAVFANLKDASYAVDWVRDGETALSSIDVCPYDVVLLDLGLPKVDGMEVLRRIRSKKNNVPILIITARDAVEERIGGLDAGADDYILKPFAMDELLARIRAASRRRGGLSSPLLSGGGITLNPATHEASCNNATYLLSAKEFALLQAFLLSPGVILSRTELEDTLYGWNEEVKSNAVEFLIHSLRKKLGADIIKNVRGAGWMIPKK